jgi:hypothetical protein
MLTLSHVVTSSVQQFQFPLEEALMDGANSNAHAISEALYAAGDITLPKVDLARVMQAKPGAPIKIYQAQ